MVSDRVNVTWSTTNATTIKVYAVGVDGTKVLITDNVQGTFRIPNGASTEWATSLAEDFGAGYIADTYSGVAGSDGSAGFVADSDMVASFELCPAFTCEFLEFDVTKTGVVTIHHPIFYLAPLADAMVWHETGDLQAITFKNGPVLRPGSQSYFNYIGDAILTTPTVVDPVFGAQTMGDGWSLENSYFKGVVADSGNLARLGAEFVSGEEFPPGVSKHLWRYTDADGNYYVDSMSFWVNSTLGPKMIYYSSWRASSQNAYFLPTKQRTTALGWSENTNYGMFRYTWATSKHPHIVPGSLQPQLKIGGVDQLTTATAPTGWKVGIFQGAVTNNEGYDWEFWWNSIHWFDMRAWRGQTAVLGLATATTGRSYIVQDSEGRLHHAYIKDGDVWYRRSDNTRSAGGWTFDHQITFRGDVRKAAFCYDAVYKRIELYYETTGHSVYYTYSHDEGATWFTASLVGTSMIDFFTATNHQNDDRFRCWFQFDAGTAGPGTAYGQYRRHTDSAWSASFQFKNVGVALSIAENGMCNVAPAFSGQGEWTFSPTINGDSAPSTWFSNDEGRTWRLQV
jgi:hypothetical protein